MTNDKINPLSNYDVSSHQYPTDLDTAVEYGGHRVVFFINVSGDGKLALKNDPSVVQDVPPNELNKKTAATVLGNKIVSSVNTMSESASSTYRKVSGDTSFTAPTIDVGKPMKRLVTAISLYIPNDLNINYGVSWGEEDLSDSEATANAILGSMEAVSKAASLDIGGAISTAGATTKGSVIASIASKLKSMPAIEKATRITSGNSKAEQLFKSVNFREFSFSYQFSPRDTEEAKNVLNIVRTFRHHMLPEYKDTKEFLYIYPSEFDVKYYLNDKENDKLEKHFTAVLTSCTISYSGAGQFATFADGMPTQINMNLTFKELSTPTKESSPFNGSGA